MIQMTALTLLFSAALFVSPVRSAWASNAMPAPMLPPQAQTIGPPVELDECKPYYTGGFLVGQTAGFEAKFTNNGHVTADVVEIQVLDASGNQIAVIRDVGNYAPGVEITHRYREGAGAVTLSPLFSSSKTHVSCTIWSVHFVDGTLWQAQAQPTGTYTHDVTPSPTPHAT
jgi:hypothetical protein